MNHLIFFFKSVKSEVIYCLYFQLGEEHERTKESSECLKHLTQQAVVFQKKMNEICKGEKSISFAPLQVSSPLLLDSIKIMT